jgi:hypothetical protein
MPTIDHSQNVSGTAVRDPDPPIREFFQKRFPKTKASRLRRNLPAAAVRSFPARSPCCATFTIGRSDCRRGCLLVRVEPACGSNDRLWPRAADFDSCARSAAFWGTLVVMLAVWTGVTRDPRPRADNWRPVTV